MEKDTKKQLLIGVVSSAIAGLILYYFLKDKKVL